MKYMNNCYGNSRIYGKLGMNLQLHAEEDEEEDEDEEEKQDDEEEEEDADKKKKERVYTKKELGAIVAKEVAKALAKQKEDMTEADKLKDMTDEQRKAHEQKEKDDEVAELRRKVIRMEMSKTASKALKEAGVEPTDEILDFVLCEDAESTSTNIEKFIAIKDAIVLSNEKERSKGKTPKVVTGGKKELTKADFDKMSYQEKVALKTKNPEEYKKLKEE